MFKLHDARVYKIWIGETEQKNIKFSDKVFHHSRRLFQDACQFIKTGGKELDGKYFTVLNHDDEVIYVLQYIDNSRYVMGFDFYNNREKSPIPPYYDYSVEDSRIDLSILDRADVYVFYEFNEYTYALSEIVKTRLQGRQVIWLDKHAVYFYSDSIIMDRQQLQHFIAENNKIRILYVNREFGMDPVWVDRFGCINLFHSVFWVQSYADMPIEELNYLVLDYDRKAVGGLSAQISTYAQAANYCRDRNLKLAAKDDNFALYSVELINKYFNFNIQKIDSESMNTGRILLSSNYILDSCLSFQTNMEVDYLSILKNDFRDFMEKKARNILPDGKRILGVLVRGTDFNLTKPSGHAKQADADLVIEKAKKMIEIGSYEYIYLATEDIEIFKKFSEEFGTRLLYVNQKRFSQNILIKREKRVLAEVIQEEEMEQQLMDYMTVLYVLSKCTSFLASGYCGGVRTALGINKNNYEDVYIYELGHY